MASIVNQDELTNISEYPNTFKRQGSFPLEKFSVFNTLTEAQSYSTSNSVAYVGQIIVVANGTDVTAYIIKNTSGELVEMGKTSSSGDVSADVEILKKQLNSFSQTEDAVKNYIDQQDNSLQSNLTTYVDSKIVGLYTIKGKCTIAELPASANTGDVYILTDAGTIGDITVSIGDSVVWVDGAWTKMNSTVDLSGYQKKLTFDDTPTADSTNPVTSGGVKAALDEKDINKLKIKGTIDSTNDLDEILYSSSDGDVYQFSYNANYSPDTYNVIIQGSDVDISKITFTDININAGYMTVKGLSIPTLDFDKRYFGAQLYYTNTITPVTCTFDTESYVISAQIKFKIVTNEYDTIKNSILENGFYAIKLIPGKKFRVGELVTVLNGDFVKFDDSYDIRAARMSNVAGDDNTIPTTAYVQKITNDLYDITDNLDTNKADKTELIGKSGTGSHSEIFNDYNETTGVKAVGNYSHAEGTNGTQALGYASHAEGSSSMAVGSCAHAENASWAFGNFSHSEGNSNAGHKLFTVTEGVANEDGTGRYTLSSVDNLVKNMKISLYNSSVSASDNIDFATITAISQSLKQIIVDKFYTPETYPIYIYVKEYPNYGDTVLEDGEESNHAEGYNTYAIGDYSHSEGYDTKAIGKISHSEGYNTSAMGYVSHVEGNNTIVYSEGSHGEGCDNIAGRMCYMVRSGTDNGDGTGTYVLSSVTGLSVGYSVTFPTNGIGRDNIDQAKITAIDTINNTITVDKYTTSDGVPLYIYKSPKLGDTLLSGTYIKNIHVEGSENKALGNISHAEGNQTTAYGKYSHSEGYLTIASGNSSHAEGTQTEASGMHSHAEGGSTYAIGQWSHAEGNQTSSIGQGCHTEGSMTTAGQNGYVIRSKRSEIVDGVTIGYYTFNSTEGYSVGDRISLGTGAKIRQLTSFYNNFAEIISINTDTNEIGVDNYIDYTDKVGVIYKFNSEFDSYYGDTIIGQYSHAEGGYTIAGGDYSHAEGYYTIGTGKYSHTEGKYNAIDKYNNYAHIVGNGISETARSNAHTLDWDGNAWFAGNVTVGGTYNSETGVVDGAKELATKEYVDSKSTGAYTIKGKCTIAELPTSANTGDMYILTDSGTIGDITVSTGDSVVWVDSAWTKLNNTVDLSGYVTETELNTSLESKADKTEIPTKTSDLINNSGYITSIPSEYVTETELNAKGYLTEHQDLSGYQTKLIIDTKITDSATDTNIPSSKAVKTALDTKVECSVVEILVPNTGWNTLTDENNNTYYKYTISNDLFKSTSYPICDIVVSTDISTAKNEIESYSYLSRVSVNDGSVDLYCFENQPTISFNMRIQQWML